MFKVKSKHSLPICIYQFLLWHLSYIIHRDGCRTGDGPSSSQEKVQLYLAWCLTTDLGRGGCINQRRSCRREYHGLSKWCSSSVQDRLNSLSTFWVSGSLLQSMKHLLLPSSCMWPCAYTRQWEGQRQDAASLPMETQLGAAGFTLLTCDSPWCSWAARDDLVHRVLLWHARNLHLSCNSASVICAWKCIMPYFPNSESWLASEATTKLKSYS